MPKPITKSVKPDALALFTDRVGEQELLHELLSPVPTSQLGLTFLLTQFYGVGGVGKSMLCQRACEIAAAEFKDTVRVVATSFDDGRWNEGTAFTEVSAELCRCLVGQKIVPRLTVALLSLHGQQTGRNGEVVGGLEAGWEMAFTAMEAGVDLTAIPGLGTVVKGARWLRDRADRQRLRRELNDRELWPEEQYGKLNIPDLEKKLSKALYHDLLDWLQENPRQHVRLLIDGFERLQSSESREDSQLCLQEFTGFFAGSDKRDASDRFRVAIFGRNKLRWDEIYADSSWKECWNLHLLGGLAEADAREFLHKTQTWFVSKDQSGLADALVKYEEDILNASEETQGGQRIFYPFYLNLAVELVERARQSGTELELGRAPADLQHRFFRYLGESERNALMILALSETFDESFFDWLVKEILVTGYSKGGFETHLLRDHSYFVRVEGREGEWRFHRLMENALQAKWQSTPALKSAGVTAVDRVLDYYGAPLLAKPKRDWTDADIEYWRRGMEIIVRQGPELGLLPQERWDSLLKSQPWSTEHHRCITYRVDFTRRVLQVKERLLAPDDPGVARTINELAKLLISLPSHWAEAEALSRRTLSILENSVGPDHLDVAESLNNLGKLLKYTNRLDEAEPLFRRALAIREKCLSPDNVEVLASLNNLANLLQENGQLEEAETFYRQSLLIREKTLDPNDPKIATSLNNLANLLSKTDRLTEAESLYRRATIIQEKALGPEHPHVASSLYNLAMLLRDDNRLAEAEPLYRQSLLIREKTLDANDPVVAASLNNLANLLADTNRLTEAEPLYRRALGIQEKTLGSEHPVVAKSLNNLAMLLEETDRQAEAVPLRLQADAIRDKNSRRNE